MPNLGPTEIILILVVVILLFGAKRLPETARSVGQSLKLFKRGLREADEEEKAEKEQARAKEGTTDTSAPRQLEPGSDTGSPASQTSRASETERAPERTDS